MVISSKVSNRVIVIFSCVRREPVIHGVVLWVVWAQHETEDMQTTAETEAGKNGNNSWDRRTTGRIR